jgi:hypothetical protein
MNISHSETTPARTGLIYESSIALDIQYVHFCDYFVAEGFNGIRIITFDPIHEAELSTISHLCINNATIETPDTSCFFGGAGKYLFSNCYFGRTNYNPLFENRKLQVNLENCFIYHGLNVGITFKYNLNFTSVNPLHMKQIKCPSIPFTTPHSSDRSNLWPVYVFVPLFVSVISGIIAFISCRNARRAAEEDYAVRSMINSLSYDNEYG